MHLSEHPMLPRHRRHPAGWTRFARGLAALIAVGLAGTLPAPVVADMVLSEVIVQFPAGELRKEIVVTNTGEETLFVTAELSEIVNPGRDDEERVQYDDPEVAGIIVTPNRLVVQPGQRKTLRLAFIADTPATDRVYRLLVKPVAGDIDADSTMLKVLIAYDVLVVVQPESPAFQLDWSRDGTVLTLTNTGNSNVLLQEGQLCAAEGACQPVAGRRIYPGVTERIELPAEEGELRFLATGAGQNLQATF